MATKVHGSFHGLKLQTVMIPTKIFDKRDNRFAGLCYSFFHESSLLYDVFYRFLISFL